MEIVDPSEFDPERDPRHRRRRRRLDQRGQQWDISAANVEELRAWLRAQQMTVEKFKTLDVYRATLPRLPWLADL